MHRRWTILGIALLCGSVARAQGPVLHEFVPDVREDEAMLLSASSPEPTAIVYDGEVIPAPEGGPLRPGERPMVAHSGDGMSTEQPGQRSPSFRPDRITELEGTLGYYTVFTPTIAPFKRVTALDAVTLAPEDRRTPVLSVSDLSTERVDVVGATAAPPDDRPRDRFWGSVVLDFTGGNRVPLPSVSPESRILTMRTDPQTAVRVEKDAADNFYAVAIGRLRESRVRVTFLTDAPREYFNAPIPDVASDALAPEANELPPPVQERALAFAAELGLGPGMPLPRVLRELTRHFRSFEESSEPPADTGDIYLDLCRARRGVCRHRAYGFVITALGLGIPSRFVMNEAHAWVEVKMPSVGWMRIDLGGAAEGLEAHDANERPRYRPVNPDPLPRPEAYVRSYTQAAALQHGMRQQDEAGGAGGESGAGGGSMSSGGEGAGGAEAGEAGGAASGSSTGTEGGTAFEDAESQARGTLALSVDRRQYEVFRGRAIEVSGRATGVGSGQGVPGLRLEVLLAGDRELLLGVTVSREHGYYRGTFGVPPDLPVGDYRLLVRTPGNDEFRPARAN